MNIFQFLRIIWARKWLIAAATGACFIGGLVVILVLPPRWEGNARVMLSTLKPDPITGQVIAGSGARTYVDTQAELIRDFSVVGQVPEQIGWVSDPYLIAKYQKSAKRSGVDFRHWAAQLIIENLRPKLLEGSNIMEISYTGSDPNLAKTVADYVRQDYIETSLALRRSDALKSQRWYEDQAQKVRASLEQAQTSLSNYERENGVLMAGDKVDVDSAQLRALASQAAAPTIALPTGPSQLMAQLSELDTTIAQEAQKLGPNHPELQALRARRKTLAELANKEESAQRSAAAAAAANSTAIQRAVQAQKARVIGKSDKLGKLHELQADVDLKLDEYNKTLARAGELAQEASAADVGITPLGPATVDNKPSFPNVPLIVGGSIALGLGLGVLSALLAELLARRIRSMDDLQDAVEAPLLAVIPAERPAKGDRKTSGLTAPAAEGSLAQA